MNNSYDALQDLVRTRYNFEMSFLYENLGGKYAKKMIFTYIVRILKPFPCIRSTCFIFPILSMFNRTHISTFYVITYNQDLEVWQRVLFNISNSYSSFPL